MIKTTKTRSSISGLFVILFALAFGATACISTNSSNAGVGNAVPSGGWMVIVKDTLTGDTVVADTDATGSLSNGTYQTNCSMSADGKYITFSSTDKNN